MSFDRSPYGTWKCLVCNEIFPTRAQLFKHRRTHPIFRGGKGWSKGLTKETCPSISVAASHNQKTQLERIETLRQNGLGHTIGRAKTPELEQLRRDRMSKAALNRITPSVTKRTEPYKKTDGTVVNLDSSYERKLAALLDEHGIEWIRPLPLVWYSKNGTKHHYFSDFFLPKYNIFIDPKNEYCFKVQQEKIRYIESHYDNCIFLHHYELNWEFIYRILERCDNGHSSGLLSRGEKSSLGSSPSLSANG